MQPRHLMLVLLIMLLYGSSYPVGKIGINNNIPPLLFSSLRVGLIFLAFLPFFRFRLPEKRLRLHLMGFSLIMGMGVYPLVYFALERLELISPIIIGAQVSVPFGIMLSLFFLGEKVSVMKWILIATSFLGIVVIAYDPRLVDDKIALLYIVIMAFFYALANMMARVLKNVDTSVLNGWHFISFVPLAILSIYFEGNPMDYLYPIENSVIFVVLHQALVVSLIGHVGMFYLYKFYSVATVLPFYSLFPIFGIILTFIIFNETLSIHEIIGGLLVIGSVYLIHQENKKDFILN